MALKLSQKDFLDSFKTVPRIALNLLLTNADNSFLLTQRNILPEKGSWHLPGSFLLKDEKISNCLKRIARDELGLEINPNKTKLLGVFENLDKDVRGHVIDIVYGYNIENVPTYNSEQTKAIEFFEKIPDYVGFNHRETLRKLGYK